MNSRRRSDAFAVFSDRLSAALDRPCEGNTDPQITQATAAARALAPSVFPRDTYLLTLRARMLAEFAKPQLPAVVPSAEGGSRDGADQPMHCLDLHDLTFGTMVLADLEPLDEVRVQQIRSRIACLDVRRTTE